MDTWGIITFVVGLIGYFALRNRSQGWATFFVWVCGVGAGIVIAAVWALFIVESAFRGFGG
jgi:hypothetical protein